MEVAVSKWQKYLNAYRREQRHMDLVGAAIEILEQAGGYSSTIAMMKRRQVAAYKRSEAAKRRLMRTAP